MSSDAEDELASPERDDFSPDPGHDPADETMVDSEQAKAASGHDALNGQAKAQKDFTKPRRKKARRACHACQRAHLTCGDERPCARCIKRGLQSQCADGVRKKAKYLHDAPPEALIPPSMGGTYTLNNARTGIGQPPAAPSTTLPQQNNYFAPAQPPTLQIFPPAPNQPMQAQIQSATTSFASQTPMSPQFNTNPQLPSTQPGPTTPNMQYAFDPSDPAFFNFDLASFNFGNQYGALEFGMLHHMSSGAHDVGGPDVITPINQVHPYGINYGDNSTLLFGQDAMMNVDFNNSQRGSQPMPLATPHNTPIIQSVDRTDLANGPYAIAIGDRPSSLTSGSPVSITHDVKPAIDGPASPALIVPQLHQHAVQHPHQKHADGGGMAGASAMGHGRKRPHDADWIYETVKKPYSYTSGFHRLLTYIKTHFTKNNLSRITQSIAVIRPALLTFAQRLTERDLVFMEVSVQRTLFEYDDFIRATGTPTVVMRRDGTVLAVSTEFTLMTGWSKAVLLGKKPNRNINRGSGGSSSSSSAAGDAAAKAAQRAEEARGGQQQVNGAGATHLGVLIAEILDQETVVEFYEDYARLAFGDPAGRAVRRGRLLKYREGPPPPQQQQQSQHQDGGIHPPPPQQAMSPPPGAAPGGASAGVVAAIAERGDVKPSIAALEAAAAGGGGAAGAGGGDFVAGENAFNKLGESEGVVDCMYCWLVRRDNFEVPQLIVMNFLPVIPLS